MNDSRKRIITEAEAAGCRRWELPAVDGPLLAAFGADENVRPPTAEVLAGIHRQAYQEGFELGHKEGRQAGYRQGHEAGLAEFTARGAELEKIFNTLAAPLEDLDEDVERSLVDLATLIARHLVRRELKTNPGEVVAVVREAVARLPVASRNPRIYLHPEDVELVRGALSIDEAGDSWRIEPDPLVTRGGCRVETDTSAIDASVEARLSAIIAKMLGGERESDRSA